MLKKSRSLQIGDLSFENAVLLAPMEGYTDQAFRRICRRLGADMVYTEFTSSEGLVRMAGSTASKIALCDDERPSGIQIYGRDPARMAAAAKRVAERNPDLIDINFGCPARKVVGSGGSGSQLMREPDLLIEIARSIIGAVSSPVTAKLRLGWDESSMNVVEICLRLQDLGIKAVTIHGRTRCQKYEGVVNLDGIAAVKEALEIPVIGNGDIRSPQEAQHMFEYTDVDAIMIGRASVNNPWIFRDVKAWINHGLVVPSPTLLDRLEVLLDHLDMAIEHKGEYKAVLEMRKMYVGYLREYHGIKVLRSELMRMNDAGPVKEKLLAVRDEVAEAESNGQKVDFIGGRHESR
jgi:tRNA-dihydrouridine synthase B